MKIGTSAAPTFGATYYNQLPYLLWPPRTSENSVTRRNSTKNSTEQPQQQHKPPTQSYLSNRMPKGPKISADHAAAVKQTEKHLSAQATIRNHNLRLMRMIKWIQKHYSEYSKKVVVKLSRSQRNDADLYHTSTHDFKYDILDADIIKAFLGASKVKKVDAKGNEIYYSFDNLRKFKDAILFGAKRSKKKLRDKYIVDMNAYIDSWKKENQKKKKEGKVEEQEADPITFPLYRTICFEALSRDLIFLWVFTVMQWNCMARSININNLTFNCFSLGKDSIIIEYWDTKQDKKGEKTSPKNCYANPYDWKTCAFTALGCYLIIMDEIFANGTTTTL